MINSLYGKALEQKRNHKYIRLVNTQKMANKLINEPNFDRFRIFNEDLCAFEMTKLMYY